MFEKNIYTYNYYDSREALFEENKREMQFTNKTSGNLKCLSFFHVWFVYLFSNHFKEKIKSNRALFDSDIETPVKCSLKLFTDTTE